MSGWDVYTSEYDTRDMHLPYELKKISGLYFLGMVNHNPITDEVFYWVKIGYASDLLSRMRIYNTHCPMLWHIDYTDGDYDTESYYHRLLRVTAIARCNHNDEWFLVDKETYLQMCKKGFKFFS